MNPSMEKNPKMKAMKGYKGAKIVYNLVLYSLTSVITCFFFSSPFWFPSISSHLVFSSLPDKVMFCFNAKCFFIVGNLIVFILVGESKLKQSSSSSSSSSSDIYEEYMARSRRSSAPQSHHHDENKEEVKNIKGVMRSSKSEVWGMFKLENPKVKKEERIKMGMRSCKSAVWGEGGMLKMEKTTKPKKKEQLIHHGEKMRSSKSAVWGESGMLKMEKITKEEQKIKTGMRSSKSAVWGEIERVKMDKAYKGKKEEKFVKEEENKMAMVCVKDEENQMGMRSSKSAVWGESERVKGKAKIEDKSTHHEEKKMGMRSCRSEIWSEGEIVRLGKGVAKEEDDQQLNMLNKRVEDFIARVNKQRLFEAKVVDHSKG